MGEIISPTNQRTSSSVGKVDDHDVSTSTSRIATLADRSPSTEGSTPDNEHDHDLELGDQDLDHDDGLQEDVKELPAPPQKRKGGRKPVSFAWPKRLLCHLNNPY
jgi:hypothetical protein